MSPADVIDLGKRLDTGGDGQIDKPEFLEYVQSDGADDDAHDGVDLNADMANVRELFTLFDSDGSGCIDSVEVGQLVKALALPLKEDEIDDLVEKLDLDQSGEVSFEEFYTWYVVAVPPPLRVLLPVPALLRPPRYAYYFHSFSHLLTHSAPPRYEAEAAAVKKQRRFASAMAAFSKFGNAFSDAQEMLEARRIIVNAVKYV